jgi:hypothetical protein
MLEDIQQIPLFPIAQQKMEEKLQLVEEVNFLRGENASLNVKI